MAGERKLFGTDGVRGPVGEKLTAELALALGRATAEELEAERPQVLIIRDTRESGHMLESALAAGMAAAGADVFLGGVLPSPAAAILVRRHGLDLAAVVSASHNPWRDNGIKFFDSTGRKLDDDAELRVEARVEAGPIQSASAGRIRELRGAREDYLRELDGCLRRRPQRPQDRHRLRQRRHLQRRPRGLRAPRRRRRSRSAPRPTAATSTRAAAPPTSSNVAEAVKREGAEIGFAYDGDGDRVLAVDADGREIDGDEIVAIAALHLKEIGELPGGAAVTVMSNYGFHRAMDAAGIEVATTKVGDRYVIEELLRRGWTIGGEQSGHIIWTDFAATGDGLAASLLVMRALAGRKLGDVHPIEKLPQYLENVPIPSREALAAATGLWEAVGREGAAPRGPRARARAPLRDRAADPRDGRRP